MKLKLYFFAFVFLSQLMSFGQSAYYIQVSSIDPLIGGATYGQYEEPNPIQLAISFCAFGTMQPQYATEYKISWYKNTTDSTTGGVLISETVVQTLEAVNIQDFKTLLPDTSAQGTFYYYVVLSEPSSTGCGMTDSLTSTTQRVDVFASATHLNFGAANDYVDCGNGSSLQITGNTITLEAYVNFNSFGSSPAFGNIINKDNITENGYMLRAGGNGVVNFVIASSGWNELFSPENTINLNQWHHISGVYDGVNFKIYVDGIEVASQPLTVNIGNVAANLNLGKDSYFQNRFIDASLDDVRIWNIARTAEQINSSKNCELQGDETGLVAYYKFNQGFDAGDNTSEVTLLDATLNNNNGTLTDFALNESTSNWLAGSPVVTGSKAPTVDTGAETAMFCANEITPITATAIGTSNDFLGDYAPSNWTFDNTNANGTISINAPDNIVITGGDDVFSGQGDSMYSILFSSNATVSFSWDYTTSDGAGFDYPQALINGIPTSFQGYDSNGANNQTGTMTIDVIAGDIFAFNMHTADNGFGAATVLIKNLVVLSDAGISYSWTVSDGGTISGSTTSNAMTPETSGTYTVTATVAGGCSATDSVVVTIDTVLAATVTTPVTYTQNETAVALTATTGGTGLLWYDTETGGTGSTTAPTPSTDTVGSTSYWVSSTNDNDCESERLEIVVTVESTLGINTTELERSIRVYPNPTDGLLTISNKLNTEINISVYDINGRLLLNKTCREVANTLDITNLSSGIYLLKMKTEFGEISKKMIKD